MLLLYNTHNIELWEELAIVIFIHAIILFTCFHLALIFIIILSSFYDGFAAVFATFKAFQKSTHPFLCLSIHVHVSEKSRINIKWKNNLN